MTAKPSDRAIAFRSVLKELAISPKEASRRSGIPYTTLMNFLNGASQSMRGDTEDKLADGLGIPKSRLFGRSPNSALSKPQSLDELKGLPIIGTVEAGAWREAIALEDVQQTAVIAPHRSFPASKQFVMTVSGPSCNRIVPDGGAVVVVPYEAVPGGLEALAMRTRPALVIFERERAGAYEYTMKELHSRDNGFILHPVSDHPDHQEVVDLNEDGSTNHVRIAFVVVSVQSNVF